MREYASCGSRLWSASAEVPVYDDPWQINTCYEPLPASFPVVDPTKNYSIALKRDSIEAVTRKTVTLSDGSSQTLDIAITGGFESTANNTKTDGNNTIRNVTLTSEDKTHHYNYYQLWDYRQALLKSEQIIDRKTGNTLQVIDYEYEAVDAPGYACMFSNCLTEANRYNRINWDRIHTIFAHLYCF
jgi:hypothetical protein